LGVYHTHVVSVHFWRVVQLKAVVGRQFQGKRSSRRLTEWPLDMRASTFWK